MCPAPSVCNLPPSETSTPAIVHALLHPAPATRSPLVVGGHSVYGAYFEGGMGYRNDHTSGIATGDEPESMYMVVAGRHYNDGCCFDYGNAEIDGLRPGQSSKIQFVTSEKDALIDTRSSLHFSQRHANLMLLTQNTPYPCDHVNSAH